MVYYLRLKLKIQIKNKENDISNARNNNRFSVIGNQ